MARADRRFGVSYPGLRRFGKVWDKTVDPLTGEEVVWDGGPGKMFNEAAVPLKIERGASVILYS